MDAHVRLSIGIRIRFIQEYRHIQKDFLCLCYLVVLGIPVQTPTLMSLLKPKYVSVNLKMVPEGKIYNI